MSFNDEQKSIILNTVNSEFSNKIDKILCDYSMSEGNQDDRNELIHDLYTEKKQRDCMLTIAGFQIVYDSEWYQTKKEYTDWQSIKEEVYLVYQMKRGELKW